MKYLKEFATQADYEAFVASGTMEKPNVSFVAETIGVHYANAPKKGVFIQHIDGSLYTTKEWQTLGFSADVSNGVAVSTEKIAVVIAKADLGRAEWKPSNSLISGVTVANTEELAKKDLLGAQNTKAIVQQSYSEGGAAYQCANFSFPNGVKGYLPSIGELWEVYQNYSTVRGAFSIVGNVFDSSTYYWSSTQQRANQAWMFTFGGGGVYDESKSQSYPLIRPFCSL